MQEENKNQTNVDIYIEQDPKDIKIEIQRRILCVNIFYYLTQACSLAILITSTLNTNFMSQNLQIITSVLSCIAMFMQTIIQKKQQSITALNKILSKKKGLI